MHVTPGDSIPDLLRRSDTYFSTCLESCSNSKSSSVGTCMKWIISATWTAQISIMQVKDFNPRDATEKFIFPSWQRDMSGWSTRTRESSWRRRGRRGRRRSTRKWGRSVWAFMFLRWSHRNYLEDCLKFCSWFKNPLVIKSFWSQVDF